MPRPIMVDPHYDLYLKYSRIVRRIYQRYSEIIEPFGMDENWIQLPFTNDVEGIGFRTAEEIRKTVESETGLTVSIGVSFSKIFAKLGSDMKKPNAVTVIPRTEYKEKVWPLPVSDLLYVGPATTRKLTLLGCQTIGDLANADPRLIRQKLGKNGIMLYQFANGTDGAQVMPSGYVPPVKSVGHGINNQRTQANASTAAQQTSGVQIATDDKILEGKTEGIVTATVDNPIAVKENQANVSATSTTPEARKPE